MLIKKTFQGSIPENKIINTYSESATDAYGCNFLKDSVIIETGENNNGSWIKYANGIMICYGYNSFTGVDITTAWGSMYETSSPLQLGDFPQTFVGRPNVFFTPWQTYFVERQNNSDYSTSWGAFWACRPAQVTNFDIGISKLAIGRWK